MRNRAFTLIELLVVIAIIAILAAILFPVFAQAKVAAKKAASISNTKQVSLAAIMYGADVDDMLPIAIQTYQHWPYADAANTTPAYSWVHIMQPYQKNLQMMVDPGVGDTNAEFGSGPNAWWANQDRHTQYGYNYLFLSPWYNCDTSYARSATAAAKPAETVMYTTSQVFTKSDKVGWFDSNAPGAWEYTAPAPYSCIWWDGTAGSGNWSAGGTTKITSSVRIKPYNGAIVGWVDGHTKLMSDSALAAGTTYSTAVPGGAADGAHINDLSKYLWSLDGTLNDLVF